MDESLRQSILRALDRDYTFRAAKNGSQWLTHGTCPNCREKELYVSAEKPWVVRCGRLNKCGAELHTRDLYPDFFENWSDRFPSQPSNPNASADAYLREMRGFDLDSIRGWYQQEAYFDAQKNIGSATVRFTLPGIGFWERIIDKPYRFGKRKATFRGDYGGTWWQPPTLNVASESAIWIVEGIFDAIALRHAGIAAVSTLSCNNYPELALKALAEQCAANKSRRPTLIWAYDGDKAGMGFTRKFVDRADDEGWECGAAQCPTRGKKRDWNDLWIADRLRTADIEDYLYHGDLMIAHSPAAKAVLMYRKHGWLSFYFDHDNRMYWFKLDIERFGKSRDVIAEGDDSLDEDQLTEKALAESQTITEICNCLPMPLYYLRNDVTDEAWYYYRVAFPHDGKPVKGTFSSGQLSATAEFKKRLLHMAAGAIWKGSAAQLDTLLGRWVEGIKTVQTIDYIGYAAEHGAYVYTDVAVAGGRVIEMNDEDYFEHGKLAVKSLSKSVKLAINADLKKYQPQSWWQKLHLCYGERGTVVLAYWLGSLFAEQIRGRFESFPFIEVVGEAGSGKSTLIEFLWKLVGRDQYEGFDPLKGSAVGFLRSMAQVSNLPVVLIESDRSDDSDGTAGRTKSAFHWDSLKSLYNGGSLRTTGVKTSGNDTYEPQFRGALVIAQNAPVQASAPIMERIIHVWLDKSRQSDAGREYGLELGRMAARDLSGFLIKATTQEEKILQSMEEGLRDYEKKLQAAGSKNQRIQKNHAQLMVMVDALRGVIPIADHELTAAKNLVIDMALERETALQRDHPMIEAFWESVEYLDGYGDEGDGEPQLNHSRNTDLIAINLNHFVQLAAEKRQQIPPLNELKRVLKASRRHKFIEICAVNSAINARWNVLSSAGSQKRPSTIKCWIFKKG